MRSTRQHSYRILVLAVLGTCLFVADTIDAQVTNPYASAYTFAYLDSSGHPMTKTIIIDCVYSPIYPNYCEHVTTKGNGYHHAHTPDWYYDMTITKEQVEAWHRWKHPESTQSGTASFSMNCHGYTTGKGMWIQGGMLGTDVILSDEFKEVGLALGGRYAFEESDGGSEHSFKITGVCRDPGCAALSYMTELTGKNGPGPLMVSTFSCDAGLNGTVIPGDPDWEYVVYHTL